MNILLSNDDGVRAPGLYALYQALQSIAHVTVIAPDRNCSGASHSLSLHHPLRLEQVEHGFYAVNGTPADCVHLGINSSINIRPDLVISGINDAPNMGSDVIYSGTVAAAIEGLFQGIPSIAVSMGNLTNQDFETAAHFIKQWVLQLQKHSLDARAVLNINIPQGDIQGVRLTRLGRRQRPGAMIEDVDPRGKVMYWYGVVGEELDDGPTTDFAAIADHYVSVTPLTTDMTATRQWQAIETWMEDHVTYL